MPHIDYIFSGFDWCELIEKWNFYIPDDVETINKMEDYEYFQLYMDKFIFKLDNHGNPTRIMRSFCKDVRKYLKAMDYYREINSAADVWQAIANIDSDYSMLRIFMPLVGYAWS